MGSRAASLNGLRIYLDQNFGELKFKFQEEILYSVGYSKLDCQVCKMTLKCSQCCGFTLLFSQLGLFRFGPNNYKNAKKAFKN